MSAKTKCNGDKAKELINTYRLYHIGKHNSRNGVGIIVDNSLKENIVRLKRFSDRLMAIKKVSEEDIIHIISSHTPQNKLDERVKRQFWEEMDSLIQENPTDEKKDFLKRSLKWACRKE